MDDLQQQVAEKAGLAVQQLRERSSDCLDYSEGSLSVIEGILAEASDYVDDMAEVQVDCLVHIVGSYILEVGRRKYDGKYYSRHDDRSQPVLIVGEPDFRIAILIFDKVRGHMTGNEADNIPFFYQGFASHVATAKPDADVLYV